MTPDIVTIHIYTKHGSYSIPQVDLHRYREEIVSRTHTNPCLQILNEACSVLSVMWSDINLVEATRPIKRKTFGSGMHIDEVLVCDVEGRKPIEALWQCDA